MNKMDGAQQQISQETGLIRRGEVQNDKPQRMTWANSVEFILALIGYGVGLGSIWRFPYLCYRNGGVVFLIPYAIFWVLLALPMTFLELSLGQFAGKGVVGVWDICPAFRGIGVAVCLLCAMVSLYYTTILGWILYYLVNTFRSQLPWTTCSNSWNTGNCHEYVHDSNINESVTDTFDYQYFRMKVSPSEEFWNRNMLGISSGIYDFGGIQWHLVAALAGGWLLICLCLICGVRSIGKAVYVTALAPYLLMFILFIRAVTLPGSGYGIMYYVYPNFRKLGEIQVWLQALSQVFFSIGIGFGGYITLASYNKFKNNIFRDTIIYCFIREATNICAGVVVFAIIGFISHHRGEAIDAVMAIGPELVFMVIPEALSDVPMPQLWTVLFFLLVLTLALNSLFLNAEVFITAIMDLMPRTTWKLRALVTVIACFQMFLITLIYTTHAGIYIFTLMDWFVTAISIYLITILECVVIGWIYGVNRYCGDIAMMLGNRPPSIIFQIMWMVVTPVIILINLIQSLIQFHEPMFGAYVYPLSANIAGWFIAIVIVIPIPLSMIVEILRQPGPVLQRMTSAFRPNKNWGPSYVSSTMRSTFDTEMRSM